MAACRTSVGIVCWGLVDGLRHTAAGSDFKTLSVQAVVV